MKVFLPSDLAIKDPTVANTSPFRIGVSFYSIILILLSLFFLSSTAVASHFKGGQLTYVYLGGGEYEVTIKSYWLKDTEDIIFPRYTGPFELLSFPAVVSKTVLADGETLEQIQKQRMRWSTPGVYEIFWKTCCRAVGANFDNNDSGLFATVNYNPDVPSSSPKFYNSFIIGLKASEPFSFDLNARDPDGHEQVYSLEIPYGLPAEAYDFMLATGFQVDAAGTMSWENPRTGTWLINIKLSEIVNGVHTGAYVTKEHILNVSSAEGNNAPVFAAIEDQVVLAGKLLSFDVEASDVEGHNITLSANGSVFDQEASFWQTANDSLARGTFEWISSTPGSYTVQFVAKDDAAASLSAYESITIVVAECNSYITDYVIQDRPCAGTNNGLISLTAPEGYSPYTYSLDSGQTFQSSPDFRNLEAGIYTGQLKDNLGCLSQPVEIKLEAVPLPEVTLALPPNICENADSMELVGGKPAGGSYNGTAVINGFFYPDQAGTGTHAIFYTYTDSSGCSNTASQDLLVLEVPAASATAEDSVVYTVNGSSSGSASCTTITGSATNGSLPYDFLWSTGETSESIYVCPTAATTYRLTVTDTNGCSDFSDVTVDVDERTGAGTGNAPEEPGNGTGPGDNPAQPRGSGANVRIAQEVGETVETPDLEIATGIQVYPNPITDYSKIRLTLKEDDRITINLIDRSGRLLEQVYKGPVEAYKELTLGIGRQTGEKIIFCQVITSKGVHILKLMK